MKYIASVSFGKDSLAMLLKLIENKEPLDEVVFFDTGMEFECIYKIRDKIAIMLKELNIKYVELKPKRPFIETMANYPHYSRKGKFKKGYGWCGGLCRWGTSEKIKAIDKYCENSIQYIGIAYDEQNRIKRLTPNKIPYLAMLKMTEKDCINYCHSMNYKWLENNIELYDILKRVSCWCCRNKNLKELENYKNFLPNYFNKLCMLEILIEEPMKKPHYLKERFKNENN